MNIERSIKEYNLPNGVPPQFNKSNIMATPAQFNGLSSTESSRNASPASRLTHIPASQLPPIRPVITTSQPAPSVNVNQLTQNCSHLSITPTSSPSKQNFNTSTPVLTHSKQDCSEHNIQANISPISTGQSTHFTHSTQSYFTSVLSNVNTQIRDAPKLTNVPLGSESQQVLSQNKIPVQNSNPWMNPGMKTDSSQKHGVLDQNDKRVLGTFLQNPPPSGNSAIHNQDLQQPPFVNRSVVHNQKTLPSVQHQQPFIRPIQNFNSVPNLNHNQNQVSATHITPQFSSGNINITPAQNAIMPNSQLSSTNTMQIPHQSVPYSSVSAQKNVTQFSNSRIPPPAGTFVQDRSTHPTVSGSSTLPYHSNIPPAMDVGLIKTNVHINRYPVAPQYSVPDLPVQNTSIPPSQFHSNNAYHQNQPIRGYGQNNQQQYVKPNIINSGFDRAWGYESCDLLQCVNVLPSIKLEPPRISLNQTFHDSSNCSPDIFRCTMTKIPDTNSLLQKSRLPLGVLIHPFKDLDHLPVIQCSTIVRCRACRTYINPFIYFVDAKRWKCNLCYRVNELPEEFQYDPVSKTYGDPSRRPEIKSSTIEYIAPSEYMLRPPQPAVYLFLLDVSHAAVESGYLHVFCDALTSSLTNLPGDARTQVGFIAFNSALHFYSLAEGLTQPHEMTILEIDDIFLPCPDNLIVNLNERKELITDLLAQLPTRFNSSFDTGSALGTALQAAYKMISSTGGRITIFQATLPTIGPGALTPREDPSQRAGAEIHNLNPANDFYKRLALDCSGQQIAVDLFIVNSQYVDLATISGISRFSGGCIHHFPLFKASRTLHAEKLEKCFKRYLTRKIGFEAVMRIRCTRGLSIHTFHGNFFVRSTDLLSLPNINPEAGFGMQVSIEESLSDLSNVCFQAALLYTSSKGERRIRVHTLCVPIATTLTDIINSADQQCIIGLLSKMAVDRSMMSSLSDAREAFINVAIDILASYKLSLNLGSPPSGLLAPGCLKLLPLYISALLKYVAFRTGTSTRLDDRVKAMCDMKTLPLYMLIQQVYPDLYPVHNLEDQNTIVNPDGEQIPQPPHLQLTARCLDSKGAFLMDRGEQMVLLVCPSVSQTFLHETLGVPDYNSITDEMYELPVLNNLHNQRLYNFINSLNDEKPFVASLHIMRDNSPNRNVFIEHLIEDRVENALSYHEFLQHLKTQVK